MPVYDGYDLQNVTSGQSTKCSLVIQPVFAFDTARVISISLKN